MQLKNTWTIWKILRTTSREWWFWTLSKTIQKCFIKIIINDFFMVKNDFHFVVQNTVRFGSTFASHILLRSVNFTTVWFDPLVPDYRYELIKNQIFRNCSITSNIWPQLIKLVSTCLRTVLHFTIQLLHETFMPWILSSLMRFEWCKVMWNLLSKTSVFKLYRVRIEFYY